MTNTPTCPGANPRHCCKSSLKSEVAKWKAAYDASRKNEERLLREIKYLRQYGNKDCTYMAEQAMAAGTMDVTP